jgi:hypothetical protein
MTSPPCASNSWQRRKIVPLRWRELAAVDEIAREGARRGSWSSRRRRSHSGRSCPGRSCGGRSTAQRAHRSPCRHVAPPRDLGQLVRSVVLSIGIPRFIMAPCRPLRAGPGTAWPTILSRASRSCGRPSRDWPSSREDHAAEVGARDSDALLRELGAERMEGGERGCAARACPLLSGIF